MYYENIFLCKKFESKKILKFAHVDLFLKYFLFLSIAKSIISNCIGCTPLQKMTKLQFINSSVLTCVSFQYMCNLYPLRMFGLWLMCLMAKRTAGMTPRPMRPSREWTGVMGKKAAK